MIQSQHQLQNLLLRLRLRKHPIRRNETYEQCAQCIYQFLQSRKAALSKLKRCGLTIRSTGPIAAGRHLGCKSLAQMPAHRNGPVSSNVRAHPVPSQNAHHPSRSRYSASAGTRHHWPHRSRSMPCSGSYRRPGPRCLLSWHLGCGGQETRSLNQP